MSADSMYAAKRAGEGKPWKSGFCASRMPKSSHVKCHGGYDRQIAPVGWVPCACDCHTDSEAAGPEPVASDQTLAGQQPGVEPRTVLADPSALTVTEPCFFTDLDETVYHADPVPASHGGSLSHSGAKTLLTRSPSHFQWERQNPVHKDVFDFGSAAHLVVLGEGPQMVEVEADNWMTKAAKERRDEIREAGGIPLLTKDAKRVLEMAAALREHPIAGKLFVPGNGQAETSLFWQDAETGCFLRSRLDWLRTTGRPIVVDYKSSTNADPDAFGKRAADFGYYMQDPWYVAGVEALGLAEDVAFLFVVQEKEPPYAVTVIQMDDESRRVGRHSMRRAIDLYVECQGTDTWPSYCDGIATASLPAWFVRATGQEAPF